MRLRTLPLILLLACRSKDGPDTSTPIDDTVIIDEDGDGSPAAEDCDDSNAAIGPEAEETAYDGLDNDCDPATPDDDLDADGFAAAEDCDEQEDGTYPGATEVCDGIDNDCSGEADDAVGGVFYADADGDGYGDPAVSTQSCEGAEGYVSDSRDCDDQDAAVSPAGDELCDGIDNDCDSVIDEPGAEDASLWFQDQDADGYGDEDYSKRACEQPEGYVSQDDDCDDQEPNANPGVSETCDGIDNDCDGDTDEASAVDASTLYRDRDSDGYGDSSTSRSSCDSVAGWVEDATDCDDDEASVHPGESEICDGLDNNCDGDTDEGVTSTWTLDRDGDGYGDDSSAVSACEAPTASYVATGGDCDDSDSAYSPSATPGCDGNDYDCDGSVDNDADGDGFTDSSCGGDDCDDSDSSVYPDTGGSCALGGSCLDLYTLGYTSSGVYSIDPDGATGSRTAFSVYCDQTTDGGGWTLVWKHAYYEVGTATDHMRFYASTDVRGCTTVGDADWCNVPGKLTIGTVDQRVTATYKGTIVWDFTGDLNSSLDTDWSGGVLKNTVELVDQCTASTSSQPEPEKGSHAMLGLTWDKANDGDYTSNCDTDRYGSGGGDCRWENCQLPSSISSSRYHTQMTVHLWVR